MNKKALFATVCLAGCLSLASMALAQTGETAKPATAPAAKSTTPAAKSTTTASKSAAPVHHASVTGSVTATVVSVDQATRQVTLKDEKGAEYSFTAEPSIKNLAQVKAGDVVTATYTESIGYVVKKGEGTPGMTTSQGTTTAPAGEKPAAVSTSKTTVTVVITAIDPKAPSVTFKGPQGGTHTVMVQDADKLEGVKVGDTVEITYTEAVSLKVHTPKAATTSKKEPAKKM